MLRSSLLSAAIGPLCLLVSEVSEEVCCSTGRTGFPSKDNEEPSKSQGSFCTHRLINLAYKTRFYGPDGVSVSARGLVGGTGVFVAGGGLVGGGFVGGTGVLLDETVVLVG